MRIASTLKRNMAIKKTIEQNQKQLPNSDLLLTLQRTLPQYFDASGNFKLDKFESELKENNIAEARDGYRLNFVGKDYARLQTGQTSETVIVPDNDHNNLPENINSENVFITGDNLEALRHLQNAYTSKIKIIYIDPPYNTGQEFVYNDRFEFNDDKLKTALGYGDAEIERLKSIQGKSSHSAWLTFMYPRVKLAQKLLSDDGIIFVSIDDNEQANLKLLLDDILGEGNFVTTVPRIAKRTSDKGTHFRPTKDYILVYAKNINSLAEFGIEKKIDEKDYNLVESDGRKYKQSGASLYQPSLDSRPNQRYYIEAPDGTLIIPPGSIFPEIKKDGEKIKPFSNGDKVWRWSVDTYLKQKHLLIFTKGSSQNPLLDENGNQSKWNIYPKVYFEDDKGSTLHPEDVIYDFPNSQGTKEINTLDIPFSFAKPTSLIKFLLKLINDENAIILDFFAGSSTTADAVMQLNSEDGGNRKFIMVQWPEITNPDSEARKAKYNTIDEISRERIKRAAKQIKKQQEEARIKGEGQLFNSEYPQLLDLGFKHYRLIEPDVKVIDKIFDFNPNDTKLFELDMVSPFDYPLTNTKGIDTILQTWLIQDGYEFNTHLEQLLVGNYQAQYVKQSAVLYLINSGFTHEALKNLLNKIGKFELVVNTVIVYPYSFNFEQMRELKNNLKNNLDQNITIIERY
jgi:adenine-specific DNA-methyltransferase